LLFWWLEILVASLSVRVAVVADAAAIAAVHVASWRGAYVGLIDQAFLDSLDVAEFAARRERSLAEPLAGWCHFVAEAGGAIVAFAVAGPTRDDDADKGAVAEVYAMYALPSAWGTGAGRALMEACVVFLKSGGFREATLWVLTGNTRARRFYETAGFRTDGATKVEQRLGDDGHSTRYRMVL
jgi:GNAT superfamily N-acetyltransferase